MLKLIKCLGIVKLADKLQDPDSRSQVLRHVNFDDIF